jgi:hypothetical protein
MGLLDMLGGNRAQMPGQSRGGFGQLLDPSVALPMAAALMGNQGNMQNFGNAFGQAGPALAQTRERNDADQQQNRTYQWLQQNAPEYAQLMDGGLDGQSALEMYARQRYAQQSGDPYKAAGGHIFDTRTQEWISPPDDQGPLETGLNPVLLQGDDGELIYGQPTKNGQIMQSQMPEGYRPVGPYDKSFQTKSGAEAGERLGEAEGLFQSMSTKMPGLESVVTQLDGLSEKATYTAAGQLLDSGMRQAGMDPREGAVAREQYIAVVNNQVLPMLRDTFGAAFTVQEGESLRATLGAADKSPKEKQAVLKAFIEQKRRDIEALARQTGRTPAGTPQRLRFNPATGDFE